MKGLISTNENCVSCNKCVRVCTSPGASYVQTDGASSVVHINADRCISCGACFAMCEHSARDYRDDTEAFFHDLAQGEPITLLLAPSFKASYPNEYGAILGGLKALGVRRIISVAFGADICTWAYLKYIEENQFYGGISTPCPVVVSYVEHCLPELIPRLIPVQSPMVCAAIYCREELGITDRLAFIGPCIGKKLETDEYADSPVHYNLTFLKLMDYVRRHKVYGTDAKDEIEYGLGSFYPAPGGLADNVKWFLGDDTLIRVVSGKTYLFGWLNKNARKLKTQDMPFFMIDALNCHEGCIEGTAGGNGRFEEYEIVSSIQRIRTESKSVNPDSPWNPLLPPDKRRTLLNKQFKALQLTHYLRHFTDRSSLSELRLPTEEEADRIFREMLKFTQESREINCSACGYNNCYDMTVAIYNGFNTVQNCLHYEKNLALSSAEKALSASRAKTAFLSRMSHEIRTPINAIIGLDSLALRNENISEATRVELTKIGASSRHLLSIINDILDMSRIESGRLEVNEKEFSFHEFLDQINVIIHGQCEEKGLKYEHRTIGDMDDYYIGDDLKLKQILINILGNAVKFTDPPGTVSFITEQETMDETKCVIRFTMKDTGAGMEPEFLPRLFDAFSQEDISSTNRYGGTGLGMAITKKYVELMGGEISVESEKGVGTCFFVSIPLTLSQTKRMEAKAETAASDETGGHAAWHLLIAEDNELNAEILTDLLELEGMTSEWAENGKAAVELFAKSEENHFDAILMDMRMPVMDGITATRELRKLNRPDAKTIPVVALTANAFEEDVKQCLDAGMNVHLSKPVDIKLLIKTLSRLLAE